MVSPALPHCSFLWSVDTLDHPHYRIWAVTTLSSFLSCTSQRWETMRLGNNSLSKGADEEGLSVARIAIVIILPCLLVHYNCIVCLFVTVYCLVCLFITIVLFACSLLYTALFIIIVLFACSLLYCLVLISYRIGANVIFISGSVFSTYSVTF